VNKHFSVQETGPVGGQPGGQNSLRQGPDERGRFGVFGGRFVAETLMPLVLDVERAYEATKTDPAFQAELDCGTRSG
jgi:tryptophan synthase beta chain